MSINETAQTPAKPTLLELHAKLQSNGEAEAVLPVRWCLTPELVQQLKDRNFKRPYLILAVRHRSADRIGGELFYDRWRQTTRYIVPLERELQYVSFSAPGENEVRAIVIDFPRDRLSHQLGARKDIFCNDGSPDLYDTEFIDVNASLNVSVPAEMFAKEPPAWVKRFVGNFFEGRPFDECHFRRRALLSFLLFAPFLLTIGMVYRLLVTGLALVLGLRHIKWRGLKPFNMYYLPWGEDSMWLMDSDGEVDPKRFPLWFINPVTFTVLPAITFGIMNTPRHQGTSKQLSNTGWWQTVGWVDGSLVGLVLAIVVIIGFVLGTGFVIAKITNTPTRLARERERRQQEIQEMARRQAELFREFDAMACDNRPVAAASLGALPENKRTVALRYQDLKSRVCKPFAR